MFQGEEQSVEQADVIQLISIDKARRLLAEDRLLKLAIKEGVLDIELVDGPVAIDGEGEHQWWSA